MLTVALAGVRAKDSYYNFLSSSLRCCSNVSISKSPDLAIPIISEAHQAGRQARYPAAVLLLPQRYLYLYCVIPRIRQLPNTVLKGFFSNFPSVPFLYVPWAGKSTASQSSNVFVLRLKKQHHTHHRLNFPVRTRIQNIYAQPACLISFFLSFPLPLPLPHILFPCSLPFYIISLMLILLLPPPPAPAPAPPLPLPLESE
jgi:hypothetical protein